MNFEFHPAANLFPLMQEEELQGLSKDIQANGQRDPIVILEGKILDGRNRWKACKLAEVEPRIRLVTLLEIGGSPTQFVLSTNLHRRHLSAIQKASVAADALPLFEEEARLRQVAAGEAGKGQGARGAEGGRGNEKQKPPVLQSATKGVPALEPPKREAAQRAANQAAQATGAGQRATTSMIAVKKAAPDVFQAVKDGKIDRVTEAERISRFSPEKRAAVLTRIEAGEKPTEAIRQVKKDEVKNVVPIAGKYKIVYADPPWEYGDQRHDLEGATGAEHHYPTMKLSEICDLPIRDHVEENAVLFIWATSPLLEQCFEVIRAWGFKYKASFIWDKVKHNLGHYNSVRHEFLLVCTRGSCLPDNELPDGEKLHDSVIEIERTAKHSQKPAYFRELIDRLYCRGNRIELFCREPAPGWVVWGNEA
jgi:N6-adenosine-specific RNA methylase IME4